MPRHKFVIPIEVLSKLRGQKSISEFMKDLESDPFNEKFKDYLVLQDNNENTVRPDTKDIWVPTTAEPKRGLLDRISWLFSV